MIDLLNSFNIRREIWSCRLKLEMFLLTSQAAYYLREVVQIVRLKPQTRASEVCLKPQKHLR